MGYTNSPLVVYTKLSPNHSGQRTHSIDRITPHCVVISIGVVLAGVVITFINKLLWLKYTILIVAFVALIIYRKRVYRIVKSVLGK